MPICNICPCNCDIDRINTFGVCQAPESLKINTYQLHFGEEPVLSSFNGSGTIFFSHCNMHCLYCQNFKISALGSGEKITEERFIAIAFELQEMGANNINLVSPTPYSHLLAPALQKIKKTGFSLPIVWNSNAYEKVETLKLLEGLVDIYLPDFRYADDDVALKYSGVRSYQEIAQNAIKEMYRQTGNLIIDDDGIAIFGTLIRLLVMPMNINKVERIVNWIYETFGNEMHISLMSQYYPAYKAKEFTEIARGITKLEYEQQVNLLKNLGFENGFIQEPACTPEWTPTFS